MDHNFLKPKVGSLNSLSCPANNHKTQISKNQSPKKQWKTSNMAQLHGQGNSIH